jgi:phospholipase C
MRKSSHEWQISSSIFSRIGRLATCSQILFWLAAISPLIALTGCGSSSASSRTTSAPTLVFSASSNSITSGQTVTLTWQTTNAASVTITATGADGSTRQISTNSQLSGSTQDKPPQDTTYAATASGPGGSAQQQAKVAVGQPVPTLTFSTDKTTIVSGDTVNLSWQMTDATSITITAVGVDGVTRQISTAQNPAPDQPKEDTTYTAVATGPGGNSNPQQVKVTVTQALPTLIFSASSNSIADGATVYLSWQTTNATSIAITAMGADGVKRQISTAQNPAPDQPTEDTTYTAVATGPGGSTPPQTVSVTVAQGAPQITQFGASPTTVVAGASTTLTWETSDATGVTFSPALPQSDPEEMGPLPTSNPAGIPIPVPTTVTYTMVAHNSGGLQSLPATVTITAFNVSLTASPATSTPNQPVQLIWNVDSSVTALTIDNGGCAPCTPLPKGTITVSPSATTTYTATATLAGGTQLKQAVTVTVNSGAASKIKHIFFMLQENRSFDNYFGVLGAYRAQRLQQFGIPASPSDVDGFNPNVVLTNHHDGKKVKPFHQPTVCTQNPTPSWDESHHDLALKGGDAAWQKTSQYQSGSFAMNNFLDTPNGGLDSNETNYDPEGSRVMGYYNQNDLPYYYDLATFFATSDRWFSPVLSATYPNRMYLFAASSFGHEYGDSDAGHPQYSAETIFRAMNQANVSWLIYYKDGTFLPNFQDWNDPTIQSRVYNIDDLMNRLAGNCSGGPCDPDKALPQVIFIESASGKSGLDEHPDNNIQKGAAYVQPIINALMNSDAWKESVFILTYDEGGGLYDHVPPITVPVPDSYSQGQCPDPNNGSYGYCHTGPAKNFTAPAPDKGGYDMFNLSGFRLPLMVISPYVKPHYVSHTPMDYTAILAFIEKTFNVPPLTSRDKHWLDNGDMSDFFDFSAPALLSPPDSSGGGSAWVTFLPTQPTNGVCDKTKESGGFVN